MLRTLVTVLAVCWLAAWFAGEARSGVPARGDLDLLGRVLIDNIHAESGDDQPVAVAGGGAAGEKSVLRAMLLSALLPGLGEIYAGGTRGFVTGATMAAADAFSLLQFVGNSRKGDDWKEKYRGFADTYYSRQKFHAYAETTLYFCVQCNLGICAPGDTYDPILCGARIDEVLPLSKQDDDDFYRQVANDEQYVMGWEDWDTGGIENHKDQWTAWIPGTPIPEKFQATTPLKEQYRDMRDRADDYYGRSDLYAWVMVIGRVVSVIDSAILVKMRNSDLAGIGTNPRLTLNVKPIGKVNVKLGLKVRF